MNSEKELKIIKYLYPTEEIQKFLCNDLYQELLPIIPLNRCIGSKNMVEKTRKENHEFAKQELKNFLAKNIVYLNMLKSMNLNRNTDELLDGYVYYLAHTNEKYKNIDIFKDKKSICYTPISIVDIL